MAHNWSGWFVGRRWGALVAVLAICCPPAGDALAGRLPVRRYGIADGLPSENVSVVLQGSRGYLWIATSEGLSRFDGYTFLDFGTADGLPALAVNDLVETADGELWLAVGDSVCRFARTTGGTHEGSLADAGERSPRGAARTSRFECFPVARAPDRVLALYEDRDGLWAGTDGGLYRSAGARNEPSFERVDLGLGGRGNRPGLRDLARAPDGALWAATLLGLARRPPRGRFVPARPAPPGGDPSISALLWDRRGRLWFGTHAGAYLWTDPPAGAAGGEPGREPMAANPIASRPLGPVFDFQEDMDGRVWLATARGLCVTEGEGTLSCFHDPPELGRVITSLTADDAGNLWLASEGDGLLRLRLHGMVSFGPADGLEAERVSSIFESRRGDLCVTSREVVSRLAGGRFVSARPRLPRSIDQLSWGWNQWAVQDRLGRWWLPTGRGLLRYPASPFIESIGRRLPERIFTTRDGLATDDVFRLFLDRHGDLWIATISPSVGGLARWSHTTDAVERIPLPGRLEQVAVTAFAEDGSGNLWLGFYNGEILRRRPGAPGFEVLGLETGLGGGFIGDLHLDGRGRLWIATSGRGVQRVDDPAAPRPHAAAVYTTRQGLASNRVHCIASDAGGVLYLGTGRGVDRLDPATGRVDHLGMADGLPASEVVVAHRDRRGILWFGTLHGLARYDPRAMERGRPPPVFIDRLWVAGEPWAISPRGERRAAGIRLPRPRSLVEIHFAGLAFGREASIRYQHRLVGLDATWSEPSPARSVVYGGLTPGRYRFEVRAIVPEGAASRTPAVVGFVVPAPFWRRWWFLAAVVGLVLAALGAAHRVRTARLLAVERVRTEIATDLHDDLGTALTRISILSAVVEQEIAGQPSAGAIRGAVRQIGATARRLLEANRELVWSLDPARDHLDSLVARLRRYTGDTLGGTGISWQLVTDLPREDARSVHLAPEVRRHLFLLLKEAVANVARHAGACSAVIEIAVNREIRISVIDDGRGFDPERAEAGGDGLGNMRRRATAMGATLSIDSTPGGGTRLVVAVPRGERHGGPA